MSLEKGNVVIDLNDKNSLKEDEKKKIKDNEVSDEQLDNFNFQELDKAIEKSFQDFLKKTLIQDRDSPESIQIQFNNWLDKECKTLDMMKESEIEQKIIGPVTFELTKDATRVELADLQKELLKNEKIKTEKDVNLKVGKEELIGLRKVYNNIDIQEIADLFSKNFKGREQLLDLLKTKTPDNIKKFQRIIVGITNPDSDSEDYKYKNGESPLSWFGVDGKFGKETLKAFKAYVDNNETTGENPVEPEVTGNNSEGTVVSGENSEKAGDEIVASVNVTGTAIPEPTKGNPAVADTSNKETNTSTIEIDQSEIDQYEYDINQLTELTEEKANEIIEKENTFGKTTITLDNLQRLTPEIAKILASFEGKLYLNGLKELDTDTLEEFKNGKCSFVKFPGGELDKSDKFSIKIADKTYSEITDGICNLLIPKTDNSGTGNVTTKSTSSDTSTSTRSTNTNNGTIGKSNQEQKNRTGGEDEPQIIEGNGTKVESQEISGDPKELEAKLNGEIKNIASNLPEIRILSDGIYIPKSLGDSRGFNVLYNPELKPYIQKQVINNDGPEYFKVPSNIKIGLVTGIFVPYLVLGDYEKKDGFNNLDSNSQVDGDPQKYNGSLTQTSLKTTKYTYTENISNEGGDNKPQTSTSEQEGDATSTETDGKSTEATSGATQSIDVQYQTSQIMSKEDYERRNENAKNERDAIKKLLGKGFLGVFSGKATEDISVGQKGYKIKLRSEEYNNLNKLYGVLDEFQEQNDKNYTLIDYFDVIFNKYQSGQTSFSGSKDLMILNKKDNDKYIQPKGFLINKYEDLGNLYVLYRQGQGGQYFNKVMGVLENYFLRGGISIEDINKGSSFTKIFEENNYGIAKGGVDLDKLNINFDNDNKSKDTIRYNEKGEKEFMAMLSDFNLDGRLDHNDRGYYMGLELDNVYRSVNIDLKNSELSEQIESGQSVWKNIVNFAIDYFENLGDTDTANELKSVSTIDELNTKLKAKKGDEGYKTLKSLQTMLKDSPVPISFICKYGNKAQVMFLNELMMDEKFDKMYDEAFENLVQQGLDPQLKTGLKPAIYASYINGGIGGGFGAAYDTKNIGTLSMSLGATHVPGSEDLQYGIVLGRDPKFLQGNIGSGKIKGGVDVGYSTQGFLALGKADFVSGIANKRQLEAMNADSVKRVNIGVSAGWLGNGLYASLKGGMSYDYIEGTINKYNELNNYLRESLTKIFDDEKFKTFFKDGKIDTSKGEEIKGFLREKLGEAGEKNEEVVNAAVENIYSGLMYFSAGLNLDESNEEAFNIAKNRIIYQLSETYTNKYISEHIDDNLDGKLKLTNRSIGPAIFFNGNIYESIFKSAYYSVVGGLGFTRYGNTYMTETDQSKASYESRLSSGLGFDYLEGSVDKDGNITKKTIDYLNDKLSIIGNYDIEKISMDDSKNIIYIPKDLFRGGVNIYLDKNLENFVESDEKGFKIPTNTEIALLTRSRTNSTQFDLVIGNYKKESDAISLSYNSELKGKPTEYKGKEKETGKTFNLDKLNNDMGKLYQREDFPLSTCEKTTDGKLVFVLEDGKKISVEDKTLLDSNGNIVVSNYGKLLITKDNNGEYKASFEKGDKEQLIVIYDDGSKISVPLIGSDGIDMGEIYGNNFATLNQSFKNFEKALSKIDDGKWNQYVKFMEETCDLDEDIVNMDDYREAFEKVKKMLNSSQDTTLNEIKQMINNINSDEEKIFIVDKFKMIFSLERRTSTVSGLKELAKRRGTKYENLKGYATAREDFPLKGFDYREKLINELGNGNVERIYDENLVGMTAFYRRGRDSTGGRLVSTQLVDALGYSMTEIGSTDYIGKLLPITDNLEGTQNWFIENLKKTEVHKNILKKIIGKKTNLEITDEQLYELLRGNEINIDNSSKKIKINVNYVFYLLGECANESVGIKLGDIETSGGGQDGNGDSVIIDAETSYQGVSGVYSGNVEAANRTVIQKVAQFGGGAIVGLGGGEPKPDDHTDPVDPPEPNPDVTTDPFS